MSLDRFLFSYSGVGSGDGPGNLITQQDLSNPYWTLTNYTVAPTNNILETAANAGHSFGMAVGLPRVAGTGVYMHTVDLIKNGSDQRFFSVGIYAIGLGSGGSRFFDVLNGTNSSNSAYGGFTVNGSSMTPIPGGWRCSVTVGCGGALSGVLVLDQDTTPLGTFNYPGVVTDGYIVSNINLFQIS